MVFRAAIKDPKRTLVIIFVLLLTFSLVASLYPFITNPTSVTEAYTEAGALAPLVFITIVAVAPTPGAIIGASGSAYFGLWQAAFYLYIGNVLAAAITFGLVRYFGRPAAQRFFKPEKLAKIDHFLEKRPFIVWFVYAFPVLPLEAVTAVIALSGKSFRKFIVIPIVALIIDSIFVTYFGGMVAQKYAGLFEYASIAIVILVSYGIVHLFYSWKKEEIHNAGKKIGAGVAYGVREVNMGIEVVGEEVKRGAAAVGRTIDFRKGAKHRREQARNQEAKIEEQEKNQKMTVKAVHKKTSLKKYNSRAKKKK